jgi:predicted DNA-binding transcriptional regulator YafY
MAASKNKSGKQRSVEKIAGVLHMITLLRQRRIGMTTTELSDIIDVDARTIRRYRKTIEEAGLPIRVLNGRYYLDDVVQPKITSAELFAVATTNAWLSKLLGPEAAAPHKRRLDGRGAVVQVGNQNDHQVDVAKQLQRALYDRVRVKLSYQSLNDDATCIRTVDPIELRFSQIAWYLYASDVDKKPPEPRTFKLSRMTKVELTKIPCTPIVGEDIENTVGVWQSNKDADQHQVRIRLHPPSARVANEYPLSGSATIDMQPDGSAIISGQVVGLQEVSRWVLRWQGDAEVLSPPALRQVIAKAAAAITRRHA